jgi:hypothetical protein
MTKLSKIINYKGHAILVWLVVEGWMAGTRYFKVNAIEHPTILGAQAEIDWIKS